MRKLPLFGLAMALVAQAAFAADFNDVPRSHWAYGAIRRAVDAGILQGYDDKFMGSKMLNRYEVSLVIQRILDNVKAKGGPAAAGVDQQFVDELESIILDLGSEVSAHTTRIGSLEGEFLDLQDKIDELKRGQGATAGASRGLANAFSGYISVGLVSTDDGTGTSGLGAQTRWTGTTADQTFFTIPQASIALDTEVRPGVVLHVQYDYSTDFPNALGAGIGVGLNEAYIMVDELFGEIGGKIGGFALPLQSWEVNGPFRSSTYTITPSVANTSFEAVRVVGAELSQIREIERMGFQWRLGMFNANDITAIPGAFQQYGPVSDAVGLGALSGSTTNDSAFGYYLDVESTALSNWGWRVSFFDLGGDVLAVAPATVTLERNGWQVGAWYQADQFRVQSQFVRVESSSGLGAANDTDSYAWYLLFNWKMDDDASFTLRYDDFENILDVGAPQPGNEGNSFTFAYNRKMSDNSVMQFEWLTVDHEVVPGGLLTDVEDDLLQLRYKVWF